MKRCLIPSLFVIAAALRLWGLGSAALWYDESFTLLLSRLPLGQMIDTTAGDTHPPLYYAITWAVVHMGGDSAFWLRLPSVVFSLIGLWAAWRIMIVLDLPEPARLAALGFMVMAPTQIHYAQEARQYALLQALILGAAWAAIRGRWVALGGLAAAALYTHNYGLFYLPALGLIALAAAWGPTRRIDIRAGLGPAVALGVAALSFVPWYFYALAGQMESVAGGYWIQPVTPGGVLYALYMMIWGFSMPDKFQPAALLLTFGAGIYTAWVAWQRRPGWALPLGLLACVPLIGAVGLSVAWKPILLFRGLIGSAPALYALGAWAIVRPIRWKNLYTAILFIPLIYAGLRGYYGAIAPSKGNHPQLITQLRAAWQPGDIVYHVNDGTAVTWGAYAPDLPQYLAPPCYPDNLGALSARTRAGLGWQIRDLSELRYNRAWIVWSEGPTSTSCEYARAQPLTTRLNKLSEFNSDHVYFVIGSLTYGSNEPGQ